ncbi:tripartite motif-containing protein 5-like [Perognathus longimembris pacificus]|uniref:tripartite motif-containing protein 5-like n=1 Tax=Perognathus longimembris pacificus TaxID=214514 RepID=UPI00201A17AF|nr:tripartite motif-containing protein 5-like [Perognathus longimembris pacificus]
MASAVLINIKEEVTCPICLELMREPVSIDCGHSFCKACITSNDDCAIRLGQEGNCSVCRMPYNSENLRPNRHIANIVQSLKEAKLSSPEQNVHHCAQHDEKLQLFCRDDGKVICWLCERSQQHRGHHTCLLGEVAQEYQNKLQTAAEKVMKNKEESEKWKAELQEGKTSWKDQIQGDIENVQAKFKELGILLASEEAKELQQLKKEEESVLNSLEKCENELAQKNELLTELLSALEHRLHGSRIEMLQDVNEIIRRCDLLIIEKPMPFPKKERRRYQAPDLRGMLHVFRELTDARRYWVHVKINKNDNQEMVISEDQRNIRYEKHCSNSRRARACPFYPPGALGLPVITSGRHYWEVDVSTKESWLLGLSDGRYFGGPEKSSCSMWLHDVNYFNSESEFQIAKERHFRRKKGFWIIAMENDCEYKVFGEDPTTGNSLTLKYLPAPLKRIGVFLDYGAGTLSFYNVTYNGLPIYKFTDCRFSTGVFPYFNPLKCSAPMKLC